MTPEGWKDLSLADIANVVGGVGFPRAHQGTQTGEFPFFKVSDMNAPGNAKELRVAANTVDETLLESLKGTLHPPGTVVFPKVGAALLTNKRRKLVVPSCFDNNVMGLVATGCDPDFLYLLMQTVDFAKHMQPGAVPSVNGSMVGSIRALVPPVPEQRKIAAILFSVDDAIEKTQAVIDQVQVVKRGLMQELFTRGLPGRHTRFKQTEIGDIPEEWGVVSLADCGANVTSGSRGWAKYYSSAGALFLRITNLARNTVRLQLGDTRRIALPQGTAESRRTRVQAGDLVISITADIGMVGVIPKGIGEAYVNQHLALLRLPDCELRPEFAGYFLATDTSLNRFNRLNDSGAKAGLNLPTIFKLTVPLPPRDEQDTILQILTTTEDRLAIEERKSAELATAKSALMSALLTGELCVTPDAEHS